MIEKGSDEYMRRLTEKLHRERLITNCINCLNYITEGEVCGLVNLRPPAKVIALGCSKWESLPF